jgi:hypothetical protein
MGKLGFKQRKVIETFIQLMKIIPEDKVPSNVMEFLAQNGLVKEEGETMSHFADRIKDHIKNVEKTI